MTVVIGILASISIVSYSATQKSAQKKAYEATAQQVKLKLGDYYTDYSKYPSIKGSTTSDPDSVLLYLNSVDSGSLAADFQKSYGSPASPVFTYTACTKGTSPCTSTNCDNTSVTTMCGTYRIYVAKQAWYGYSTDSDITIIP